MQRLLEFNRMSIETAARWIIFDSWELRNSWSKGVVIRTKKEIFDL